MSKNNTLVMETEPEPHVTEDGQIAESSAEISYSPDILCRICGVHSDYLVPIFTEEGLDQQLHPKIEKYLPIKVLVDDKLPKNVCYHCASALLAWHELVENCKESEKKLNSLVRSQSKEEERSTDTKESHLMRGHADDPCLCEICGVLCKSGHAFHLHKRKHSAELTEIICCVCGKNFAYRSSLKIHMAVHSTERPWTCEICNKKYKLKHMLNAHKRTHQDLRPYACIICNMRLKTKSALLTHNQIHNDIRPYPCPYCQYKAKRNSYLRCHVRTHTGEKPYKCDKCGRGFVRSTNMKKHRRNHEKHKM